MSTSTFRSRGEWFIHKWMPSKLERLLSMVKTINDESYVSFKLFLLIVGLMITLQGMTTSWLFIRVDKAEQKAEKAIADVVDTQRNYSAINVNLAEIKVDILWIRKGLDDHMKATK